MTRREAFESGMGLNGHVIESSVSVNIGQALVDERDTVLIIISSTNTDGSSGSTFSEESVCLINQHERHYMVVLSVFRGDVDCRVVCLVVRHVMAVCVDADRALTGFRCCCADSAHMRDVRVVSA